MNHLNFIASACLTVMLLAGCGDKPKETQDLPVPNTSPAPAKKTTEPVGPPQIQVPAIVPSGELLSNDKPAFNSLKQATTYLDKCLAAQDRAGLAALCIGGVKGKSYFAEDPVIFEILVEEWKRAGGSFQNLYAQREFPKDAGEFKLGGHESELGNVHIDFVKQADGWRLKDIWVCG